MCDLYAPLKHDYLYRGDIFKDVPFVSLDGKPIHTSNPGKDVVKRPWVPLWERMKSGMPKDGDVPCLAALQLRPAIIMTRTCEANKRAGVRRIYPAIYMAPIRPLSDFDSDTETGAEFAEKVAKGFPPEEGSDEQRECYRFAVINACAEHGVDAGLICFREMQPVHLKYLMDDTKKFARLSTKAVHAMLNRFHKFMVQQERDDEADNEAEGPISPTLQFYKAEREKESTKSKTRKES